MRYFLYFLLAIILLFITPYIIKLRTSYKMKALSFYGSVAFFTFLVYHITNFLIKFNENPNNNDIPGLAALFYFLIVVHIAGFISKELF